LYEHEWRERSTKPKTNIARFPDPKLNFWHQVRQYLNQRQLDPSLAEVNRCYPSVTAGDKYLRLVIPAVRRDRGTFWQARAIRPDVEKRWQSPAGVARGDALIVFHPAESLGQFGRFNGKLSGTVIICEGPLDALAIAMTGNTGVSVMGVDPTDETFKHLLWWAELANDQGKMVYTLFDADDSGLVGGISVGYRLAGESIRIRSLFLANVTDAKDFAEVPADQRQSVLEKLMTQ
jgi:hypothetical protein